MKKILFVLAVAVFTAGAVKAQKPEVITSDKEGWHKIGEAKVDFKTEKDKFVVMGADRFKKIQVRIKNSPIHIEDMEVRYDGGGKEDISLRSDYNAGTKSRIIDLKNYSSELKSVTFVYRTVPNAKSEKAEIELWGLK